VKYLLNKIKNKEILEKYMGDGSEVNQQKIEDVLRTIYDPEIPVSIYELGLIYDVSINEDNDVSIKMTLTTPNCPEAESLPPEVERKVNKIPGVRSTQVEIVWEPTWNPNMMTEAAKLQLGML
jgi:FeS assembly SUF system protein